MTTLHFYKPPISATGFRAVSRAIGALLFAIPLALAAWSILNLFVPSVPKMGQTLAELGLIAMIFRYGWWLVGLVVLVTVVPALFRMRSVARASENTAVPKQQLQRVEEFASKLGLKLTLDRDKGKIGEMAGLVNGREASVDLDSLSFQGDFKREYAMEISSSASSTRPEDEMVEFQSQNQDFNKIFETRHASQSIADAFTRGSLPVKLVEFVRKWTGKVKEARLTQYSFYADLYPHEGTEDNVRAFLMDVVAVADAIDSHLAQYGTEA